MQQISNRGLQQGGLMNLMEQIKIDDDNALAPKIIPLTNNNDNENNKN